MSQRMRKKRNFSTRMSALDTLLVAKGSGGILNMKEAAETYRDLLDYREVFGNENPVCLEIGCGKGGFVCETAKRNPHVNYLAAEMLVNVVLAAMENASAQGADNVRFMNVRAECLQCFIPENSLDTIYLNFSTPLPKQGYAGQRLTHRRFLEIYKRLLKKGGRIIQKTDDRDFFDFSLEEMEACGLRLENITYDLHEKGNPAWNIVTEYERRWVEGGKPIHRVEGVYEG